MTTPSTTRAGVGFRHCQVLVLDSSSYPASTSSAAYEGDQIEGARSLAITDPEPQQIVHRGDDRVFQLDTLPPTEPISGTLTVSKTNDAVDDLVTDDIVFTVGEMSLLALGTDNRGDENQCALLAYRQTLDVSGGASEGSRRWEFRLFPKCYVIPIASGFDVDTPEERTFAIRPQFVAYHLWGTALATATEGCLRAQAFRGISEYKPRLVAFDGDGTTTDFLFSPSYQAASTDKQSLWIDGTLQTAGQYTMTTAGPTFQTAPTTQNKIVMFYEHE